MMMNFSLISRLVLLGLLLIASYQRAKSQVDIKIKSKDLLEKANRLYAQGRYDVALSFFKELSYLDHQEPLVMFKKGYSYIQCMMIDDAIRIFEKLVTDHPDHSQGWFYLAYAYRMKGRYEAAQHSFKQLMALNEMMGKYWLEANEFIHNSPQTQSSLSKVTPILRPGSNELFVSQILDKLYCASTSMNFNTGESHISGPDYTKGSNRLCSIDPFTSVIGPSEFLGLSPFNISHLAFSPANGMVAYVKNRVFPGMRQITQMSKEAKIFFAFLDPNGKLIEHFEFDYNDDSYANAYPFLSENGQTLYFASNMPGGYGGFDIYVCYWTEDGWSEPQNLGPRINTPGDEISPYFDGTHLYFSSDWHPGYGGLDIFKVDFDYESWNVPVNMGAGFNSNMDDFGYIFFEKFNKGYFISNRDTSHRGENLFEFYRNTKKILFQITDFKKKNPITGVVIDLGRCGMGSGITDESGEYVLHIPEGFDCYVGFHKVGYTSSVLRLKYATIESHKKTMKIMLNSTGYFYEGLVMIQDEHEPEPTPIPGVYVSAINEVDGELQETYSDENGKFNLQIKPRGRYFISLAKSGYRPHHKSIKTDNKVDSSILGVFILERADNIVIRDVFSQKDKSVLNPQPEFQIDQLEASAKSEQHSFKSKKKPKTPTPPDYSNTTYSQYKGVPIAGYVVQVAAIARKNIDINPFISQLGHIGNLYYTQRDDNLIRIVVGVFSNRIEAVEALNKVKTNDKFKEAFISELPENVEIIPLEKLISKQKKSDIPSESYTKQKVDNPKEIQTAKPHPTAKDGDQKFVEYMVQIGKFKNLNWFDNREIEKLGLIEERREGGYVIVLLSGYSDYDEAKTIRDKVRNLGYKDAFIVVSGQNGELVKYQR